MAISDKTRKLLWGRSGAKCAFCKTELVIEPSSKDDESIVGDECHIHSTKENGPRYDISYSKDKLDSIENILLLCKIHHKMIDDQQQTFTAKVLRDIKKNHEKWVKNRLSKKQNNTSRIKRIKENIPSHLHRLLTGEQVFDIIVGACQGSITNDELYNDREVELVGNFFQFIQDYGELWEDIQPADRVKASYNTTKLIEELDHNGFWVFGAKELQRLEGGINDESMPWPIAILKVMRNDNKEIIKINL